MLCATTASAQKPQHEIGQETTAPPVANCRRYRELRSTDQRTQTSITQRWNATAWTGASHHLSMDLKHNCDLNIQDLPFEFVDVREPSGKLDTATGARVRKHVMRRFHQERYKARGLRNATHARDQRSLGSKSGYPLKWDRNLRVIDDDLGRDPQECFSYQVDHSVHEPDCGQSVARVDAIAAPLQRHATSSSAPVSCLACGRFLVQTWPANGKETITNGPNGPRTLLNKELLDPFNSSVTEITPRMHELLHHCTINLNLLIISLFRISSSL